MSIAEKAAAWAEAVAAEDRHGYDQQNRWGPDYDCSSLVISAYQQAGVPVKDRGATYTGNMRSAFLACGFVDATYEVGLSSGYGIIAGDVLLNDTHHACIAVTNGIKSGAVKTHTATTTKEDYEMLPLLKKGAKGKAVKVLQLMLGNVTVDGDFGDKTLASVKAFQKAHGLEVDGEVGQNTWKALILAL